MTRPKLHDDLSLRPNERRVSITSCDKTLDLRLALQRCQAIVHDLIQNFLPNRPAGLIHARTLSKVVKRVIQIWQSGQLIHVFGRDNGKSPIDLEYTASHTCSLGHWSLLGGRNPVTIEDCQRNENDCLYDAVAAQTGLDSGELRRKTGSRLRREQRSIARYILANCGGAEPESLARLMLGGARYTGNSPGDAQRVLDASQNSPSHPDGSYGHPRGHASHSSTGRDQDSVETYSMSRWRSGFLSRGDQDLVCHYTLITGRAMDLMEQLNRGQFKAAEHISRNQLDYDPLPQAQIWSRGERQGEPAHFRQVCLVGKHFLNMERDANADIFVLTFYPEI